MYGDLVVGLLGYMSGSNCNSTQSKQKAIEIAASLTNFSEDVLFRKLAEILLTSTSIKERTKVLENLHRPFSAALLMVLAVCL